MSLSPNPNFIGILLVLCGSILLSVNDFVIKFLSDGYALHQIILIRAALGVPVVILLIKISKTGFDQLVSRRWREHLVRVALVLIANVTFFVGLAEMNLADAVATAFVAPVLVTLMSAVILREQVGPHRWASVIVGLIGVFVMMRPTSGALQPAAILVLISAASYAGMHIMTRQMRDTESAATLSFYVQAGFIATSLAMGLAFGDGSYAPVAAGGPWEFLFRPWVWPPLHDWPILLAIGVTVTLGGLMVSQAYRLSEAALIAPFEYIGIPMAIFWGLVVFGTWPDGTAWVGIALICGAGLYTLLRETMRRKDVDVAAPSGDL